MIIICMRIFVFLRSIYCFDGYQMRVAALANQRNLLRTSISADIEANGVQYSTLQGKALKIQEYPTLGQVKSILPSGSFEKSTLKSLGFALLDLMTTSTTAFLGIKYLLYPASKLFQSSNFALKIVGATIWALYSILVGTCGIGLWVTAHECGHGAFSNNKKLQDFVGYLYHSLLLVPYFSWQRSHAVHHAATNHIEDGETHVPPLKTNPSSHISTKVFLQKLFGKTLGEGIFGAGQVFLHLFLGWPAYLMFGATGGPSRGITNHFVPIQFPRNFLDARKNVTLKELFPGAWKRKVFLSDIGVVLAGLGLYFLSKKYGLPWVVAAYGGPYLIVNAWLVGYTWLQHTEVDVPHLPASGFHFMKGAFQTIDRPYPNLFWGLVDFLHHHIGSTHVLHHIDSTIPHYRAVEATKVLKENFPEHYLYESTPIFSALWRIATKCFIVEKRRISTKDDYLMVFVDSP